MPRQRRRSRRGLQGKLAKSADDSKLLHLLLTSVWFRLALLGVLVVVLGIGGVMIPFIKVTPEGVSPVVHTSGLSLFQAHRLRGNAEALTKAEAFEEADYFWRASLRKNPGSITTARAALENALKAESQDLEWLAASVQYAHHYLNLTQTNDTAVALVADFCSARGLTSMISGLLETRKGSLSPTQEAMLLKAYFQERRFAEFIDHWQDAAQGAKADEEVALYYAAYQAGWGGVDESVDALRRLRNVAEGEGELAPVARKLLLSVYGQNRDVDAYGEMLAAVRAEGEDSHYHHAVYWVLLFESSRPNVARHQAEDYWANLVREPVTSASELGVIGRAYSQIGLPKRSLDLFKSLGENFKASTDYWSAYGSVLVSLEDWDELRVIALKIRNDAYDHRVLRAYSYFLEGLAEAGQERVYNAGRAFDMVIETEAPLSMSQSLDMAWQVYGIGYPEIAVKLVSNYRADLERNLRYWEITFASAYKLKRADLILEASKRMMAIEPNNVVSLNNYAAALLVERDRPEEAIRYTLQLYSRDRSNVGFMINHALALLQNERLAEAESILRGIDMSVVRPELATSIGLGWFELYVATGDTTKAKQALLDVNESHLFPEQKDWLLEAKKKLDLGAETTEAAEPTQPAESAANPGV